MCLKKLVASLPLFKELLKDIVVYIGYC